MRYIAFLILTVYLGVANAHDVYKWIAPDGSTYYSDQPHTGADRIVLPKWYPPQPPHSVLPPPVTATKPVFLTYNSLTIIKPASGENVRDNQGNVEVTLAVEPDLNTTENHKIQILLDGWVQGDPSPSLEQSLTGIKRGRRTVVAQVINEQGRVLIGSRPVTFHMKISTLFRHLLFIRSFMSVSNRCPSRLPVYRRGRS